MPAVLPFINPLNVVYPPDLARAMAEEGASHSCILTIPCDYTMVDGAVLYTVPANLRLLVPAHPFWEVLTSWTGGASSAVGVSSSNANYNTKGDLLGGATGDVAATMVSTGNPFKGTIGAKVASQGLVVLVAGDTVHFDRITSAFTAGTANLHLPAQILPAS